VLGDKASVYVADALGAAGRDVPCSLHADEVEGRLLLGVARVVGRE